MNQSHSSPSERMTEQGTVRATVFVTRIAAIILAGMGLGTVLPISVAPACFVLAFLMTVGPWSR